MLALLKKIGLPASVAALVALLVTIIPLVFKFDNRYAKEDDVDAHFTAVTKQISDLTVEVGQLAGTTQVLVTVLAAQSKAQAPAPAPTFTPRPLKAPTPPPPAPLEQPKNWKDLSDGLLRQQQRLIKE